MKVTQRILEIKTGSEGPTNDPYFYEELIVKINGNEYCIHLGLTEWFAADGITQLPVQFNHFESFKMATGMTPNDFHKYRNRLHSKCRKCGNKRFTYANGYPGESFKICVNCKKVANYYFNESAII